MLFDLQLRGPVTALSAHGVVNAARYNLSISSIMIRPLIMIAVLSHPVGPLKDSAENIYATCEFVANLALLSMEESTNLTNIKANHETTELKCPVLGAAPSASARPTRIASHSPHCH